MITRLDTLENVTLDGCPQVLTRYPNTKFIELQENVRDLGIPCSSFSIKEYRHSTSSHSEIGGGSQDRLRPSRFAKAEGALPTLLRHSNFLISGSGFITCVHRKYVLPKLFSLSSLTVASVWKGN